MMNLGIIFVKISSMDFFFTFSSYEEENLTRRIGILEFVTKESEKFEKRKRNWRIEQRVRKTEIQGMK